MIKLCNGGIMAMKIESKAAYIGTVMKLLTALSVAFDLVWSLRQNDLSRVDGGVG